MQIRKLAASAALAAGLLSTAAFPVAAAHFGGGFGGGHIGGMGHIGGGMGHSMAHMGAVGHMGHMGGPHVAHGHFDGHFDHGGIAFHDHGHHHGHNRFFIAGVPYFYGDDYYSAGYYGGCGYLYSRAVNTGSPYWWRRYEDCID